MGNISTANAVIAVLSGKLPAASEKDGLSWWWPGRMVVEDAMLCESNLARTREFEVASIRQMCIACAYVSQCAYVSTHCRRVRACICARVHMCASGRILASDPLMPQPLSRDVKDGVCQGCERRGVYPYLALYLSLCRIKELRCLALT